MNPINGIGYILLIPAEGTEGGLGDDDDSHFECYDRFQGKSVHIDVDKMAEISKPTIVLLPNRSEEDKINSNGETQDREGDTFCVDQIEYINQWISWAV